MKEEKFLNHVGERYAIQTFFLKPMVKNLKFKVNFNSEKVVFLSKCRICEGDSYIGKKNTKFRVRFKNYESVHMS